MSTNQTDNSELRTELEKHIPFSWHQGTCVIWNEPDSTSADCDCPTLHEQLDSFVEAVKQQRARADELTFEQEQTITEILENYRSNPSNSNKYRHQLFAYINAILQPPTKEAKG